MRGSEQFLKPLTSEERQDCFVIDDSLYERTGYKRTELAARVFDHVSMRYKKGFRLLTHGWTDGCSFLPINSVLLSSTKDENVLGRKISFDHRTLSHKRQDMACEKATTVMIRLLKEALHAGASARYVLFDSRFSRPRQLLDIIALRLHTIAMIKRSAKEPLIK
ncbi:MAG: transposase [Selenomonas bovis]|nr:transposase [Selenomonas bovis]